MKVSHRSFPENKFRQVVSARSRRCSTSGSPTLSRSLGRLRAAFPVPDFSSKAPEFPDPKNWSRCPWCPSIRPPSTRRRCRRTRRQRRRWRRPVTTSTTITFRSTWGRRYGVAPSLRSFEGVPTLKQASSEFRQKLWNYFVASCSVLNESRCSYHDNFSKIVWLSRFAFYSQR